VSGCPAMDMIRREVALTLDSLGVKGRVRRCCRRPGRRMDERVGARRSWSSTASRRPTGRRAVGEPVALSPDDPLPLCVFAGHDELSRFRLHLVKSLWRCNSCRSLRSLQSHLRAADDDHGQETAATFHPLEVARSMRSQTTRSRQPSRSRPELAARVRLRRRAAPHCAGPATRSAAVIRSAHRGLGCTSDRSEAPPGGEFSTYAAGRAEGRRHHRLE